MSDSLSKGVTRLPTIEEIAKVYDHYYTDNHFAALQAVFELGAEYGRAKQREESAGQPRTKD